MTAKLKEQKLIAEEELPGDGVQSARGAITPRARVRSAPYWAAISVHRGAVYMIGEKAADVILGR